MANKTEPKQAKAGASTEPQDGGWHKIPDAVVDELLAKGKLSPGGLQLALLLIIQRHTWGAKGRPAWAKLSIAKLAKMCSSGRGKGDGYTPRAIATALGDMIARGIIAGKNAKGQPLRAAMTPEERAKAAKSTAPAMYQSTPDRWKAAPKYVAPEAEDEEPIAVAAEDEEPIAVAADKPAGTPIILLPGAKSKPMPMRIVVKGKEPVDIQWRAHNTSPAELSFLAAPAADGITFVVAQKGEEKANDYVSRVPKSPREATAENAKAYSAFLRTTMMRYWRKSADGGFIVRIIAEAKGAPVELFEDLVSQRLGPNNRGGLKSGILIDLAKDAARAWAAESAERDTASRRAAQEADASERRNVEEAARWAEREPTPWTTVRKAVRQQITDDAYRNWFARTRFGGIARDVMLIEVPDDDCASFLRDEYGELVNRMAKAAPLVPADSVRFVPIGAKTKGAGA
jgi:hypothetical protein